MNEPKPTTVKDLADYHREKDECHACYRNWLDDSVWACHRHPKQPRFKSVVDDGFLPAQPISLKTPKQGNK